MSDESPISGSSETPRNMGEQAADAAIDAASEYLEAHGQELEQMFLTLKIKGVPAPYDSASAAHNVDDPREVFAFLVTSAMGVGRQLGITIKILPLKGPVGRG